MAGLDLRLIGPDPGSVVSGGHLYNAQLLRYWPGPSQQVEPGQLRPLGRPGIDLVDSLCLGLAPPPEPRRRTLLLAHHLPSLEPGPSASEPLQEEARALRRAAGVIATSEFCAQHLGRRGIESAIFVCTPGLDGKPHGVRTLPSTRSALWVGNLIPRKGLLDFLEELGEVPGDQRGRLGLEIVGGRDVDPGYAEACLEQIATMEGVRFLGKLGAEEIQAAYGRASLFVASSRMETFGMALQEARHHGLPVLAHRGGYTDLQLREQEGALLLSSMEDLAQAYRTLARDRAEHAHRFEQAQTFRPSFASWEEQITNLHSQLLTWWKRG